jgi:hypothetical protein
VTRSAAHCYLRLGSFSTIPHLDVGSFRAYAALWHGRLSPLTEIIDGEKEVSPFHPWQTPGANCRWPRGPSDTIHSHRHPLIMFPRPRGETGEALCALVTVSSEQ